MSQRENNMVGYYIEYEDNDDNVKTVEIETEIFGDPDAETMDLINKVLENCPNIKQVTDLHVLDEDEEDWEASGYGEEDF